MKQPRNVNTLHKAEVALASFNERLAIKLTHGVGTMLIAYCFAGLALIGLLAILGILPPLIALLIAWLSQTFLQLVFLPILSVGQNVLGRKQELQANEDYQFTLKIYADVERLLAQQHKHDEHLLEIMAKLQFDEDSQ
ncbi:MAG: hypothetical protein NVS4B1_33350 [Ktedonobacteraceae bacterium]